MAQINESERRGDLTEAQAELARQNAINAAALDAANIRRLEAEAVRLEKTNPGSAEAQTARTEYEKALTDALKRKTKFDERTEDVTIQKLEADRDKVIQDVEQGKREHDITFPSGEKVKVSTKEALDFYKEQLQALGRREGGLTDFQRNQIKRQEREDAEKTQKEASAADHNIRNSKKEKKDVTGDITTFNSKAREPYAYVPSSRGEFGFKNPIAQIPLPKVKQPGGKEVQLTAEDMYREWSTNFKALTFKEFLKYYYTEVLKQKPPEALLE